MKRIPILFAATVALAIVAVPHSTFSAGAVPDVEQGKKVFQQNCLQCHSATTTDTKVGPGLKGLFKNKKMPASGKPVTDANVRAQIVNGGGGMPAFGKVLEKADIDSLIEYLKTL